MSSLFDTLLKSLIKRPLLVNLVLVFIILTAILSVYKMKTVSFPSVDMYQVNVVTYYPGASPLDVELNVTRKLEEAIEQVADIKSYNSESLENMSVIYIEIDRNTTDLQHVKDRIRQAIQDVTDLPDEVTTNPRIDEDKSDNWPICGIGLSSTDGNMKVLYEHHRALRKELLLLPSVGRVYTHGDLNLEYKIELDKQKMTRFDIGFEEVIHAIKYNKIRLSAGSIESYTSEKGIVTLSEFESPGDIGEIIIRSNDVGSFIKLNQVADIYLGFEDVSVKYRINGRPGMLINVIKQSAADMLHSVDEINACVEKYKKRNRLPDTIRIETVYDESIETRVRLNILYSNALAGLFLVVLILFLFFSKRIAFWTSAGIPVAVGLAFIAVSFLDVTINRISLVGLIVVLGMLVDDSIIVAETIYRYEENGDTPVQAAIKGTRSIIKPIIATVVTTVIAFCPIYFIPGTEFDFSREVPTFVIAMLLGSLLEAIIILPVHIGHEKAGKVKKKRYPPGEKILIYLEKAYVTLLRLMLNHKFKSLGCIVLFLVAGFTISHFTTRFVSFPIDQAAQFWLYGETKRDSNLDHTREAVRDIEKLIAQYPRQVVKSYTTSIGSTLFSYKTLPNQFVVHVTLTPSTERDQTVSEIVSDITGKIKENDPAIKIINNYIDGGAPPAGKPIEIRVISNNNDQRNRAVQRVIDDLQTLNIIDIDCDLKTGKNEEHYKPVYTKIAMAQLDVSTIASVLRTAFDGIEVAHQDTAREQIPYRVILQKSSINYKNPLKDLFVTNRLGRRVPVDQLVRKFEDQSVQTVYRYNGIRCNTIFGNIDYSKTTPEIVYNRLEKHYSDFEKKTGCKMLLGGEAERSSNLQNDMKLATLLAVIAIYFFLVIQFNSFIQPALVLIAIPCGLVGILIAFTVQHLDLSMLALLGIMGFAGVVVNDSIIMVDLINKLRSKAPKTDGSYRTRLYTFNNAIIEGAQLRLRPIIMTTVTTVAGLLPTAYGLFGGHDSFISPMVMAMAWGLIIGTPSVLIVIPVIYSVIEGILLYFKKR